jgi:hypothetical protein
LEGTEDTLLASLGICNGDLLYLLDTPGAPMTTPVSVEPAAEPAAAAPAQLPHASSEPEIAPDPALEICAAGVPADPGPVDEPEPLPQLDAPVTFILKAFADFGFILSNESYRDAGSPRALQGACLALVALFAPAVRVQLYTLVMPRAVCIHVFFLHGGVKGATLSHTLPHTSKHMLLSSQDKQLFRKLKVASPCQPHSPCVHACIYACVCVRARLLFRIGLCTRFPCGFGNAWISPAPTASLACPQASSSTF